MKVRSLITAAAVVLAASLTGCAVQGTLPTKASVEKARTFDAPFDVVWPAIISGIAETNLKITTLEKASGLIAIADSAYSPSDADEGTRGSTLGKPDEVIARSANLNIFATSPAPGVTRVQVNVGLKMNIRTGNGSLAYPFRYQWAEAASNGGIEKAVLDGVATRLPR
jgi:hypothetical protein